MIISKALLESWEFPGGPVVRIPLQGGTDLITSQETIILKNKSKTKNMYLKQKEMKVNLIIYSPA